MKSYHIRCIHSVSYIKPYQVEKINIDRKDTVTIFTPHRSGAGLTRDGWFDEKRLVIKAKKV